MIVLMKIMKNLRVPKNSDGTLPSHCDSNKTSQIKTNKNQTRTIFLSFWPPINFGQKVERLQNYCILVTSSGLKIYKN